jgi:hypothetical protein
MTTPPLSGTYSPVAQTVPLPSREQMNSDEAIDSAIQISSLALITPPVLEAVSTIPRVVSLVVSEFTWTARLVHSVFMKYNIRNERSGETTLMWAARHNYSTLALSLIQQEVEIDSQDDDGDTALAEAAYNGNSVLVKSLLQAGADQNHESLNSTTPYRRAAMHEHTEVNKAMDDFTEQIKGELLECTLINPSLIEIITAFFKGNA